MKNAPGHPPNLPHEEGVPVLVGLPGWRKSRGMSQAQLAKEAHLTQAGVSHLERGLRVPTLRTVGRLARALRTSPSELLQVPGRILLSREVVDRVARNILFGKPPLSAEEAYLAQAIGSRVIQKLRAHRVPGRFRYSRARWATPHRAESMIRTYGKTTTAQILHRLGSLLSMAGER